MIKLINYCAGALISILCVSFVGCNKSDEIPNEIKPVPRSEMGDEVAAFFDENKRRISNAALNPGGYEYSIDSCMMINSVEELPKLYYDDNDTIFEIEYPAIDFDIYTLVVGLYVTGGARYLSSQSLVADQDAVTMNITVKDPGGLQTADVRVDPFWGLYPKIESKHIKLNVIRKY